MQVRQRVPLLLALAGWPAQQVHRLQALLRHSLLVLLQHRQAWPHLRGLRRLRRLRQVQLESVPVPLVLLRAK